MNLTNKRIGIWGYGITGRSTVQWALKHGAQIGVMDKNELTNEAGYFTQHSIRFFTQDKLEDFFEAHDFIIPSAGIDLRPYYEKYKDKWLFELDIFAQEFKKPYVAITGSVGKTTITTLLSQLLERYGKKILTGGNIGIASLDLLAHQNDVDLAVLEVSSFQLEHANHFAPSLAIITNIIENHLDRHGTMEEYTKAKLNIQKNASQALIPLELKKILSPQEQNKTIFFSHVTHTSQKEILEKLPPITFDQNWQIIISTLKILGLPLADLPSHAQNLKMPEHRVEYVTTIRGAHIYNDSKSTAPTATLAAVERLGIKPIHLLIGGLSKGIDRKPMIAQLAGKVKTMYCFGKEADTLHDFCLQYEIPSQSFATLEDATSAALAQAQANEIILLSPAGSSYDLFENFEHRGREFKRIILALHDNTQKSL